MNSVITSVLGQAGTMPAATPGEYSNTLVGRHAASWTHDQSPADMRKLVDGLIAATRAMENRTKSLESELQKSSDQVSELRSKLDDVRKESLTDPLTGIANRKAFDAALAAAEEQAGHERRAVSLLICDIDHFKKFNDSWGHQTGDQVLRLVANCLSENVKGRDTAARYGGEEFGVVLRGTAPGRTPSVSPTRSAMPVEGRKLVKKSTGDVLGTITISIGVAQFAPGEKRRDGDPPGRCLPLWRQAEWPQSGDLRNEIPVSRCFPSTPPDVLLLPPSICHGRKRPDRHLPRRAFGQGVESLSLRIRSVADGPRPAMLGP